MSIPRTYYLIPGSSRVGKQLIIHLKEGPSEVAEFLRSWVLLKDANGLFSGLTDGIRLRFALPTHPSALHHTSNSWIDWCNIDSGITEIQTEKGVKGGGLCASWPPTWRYASHTSSGAVTMCLVGSQPKPDWSRRAARGAQKLPWR